MDAQRLHLNDKVHVVTTDGETHNAFFVTDHGDGTATIELDDNVSSEVVVDRSKVRRDWSPEG